MKSWLVLSRSEKHRCFQMNWEMGSRNLDPLGRSGAHSGQGVDLRKRRWKWRLVSALPRTTETLGESLPTFGSRVFHLYHGRVGFSDLRGFFQPQVSGNLLFQSGCREAKGVIQGGDYDPRTSVECKSF